MCSRFLPAFVQVGVVFSLKRAVCCFDHFWRCVGRDLEGVVMIKHSEDDVQSCQHVNLRVRECRVDLTRSCAKTKPLRKSRLCYALSPGGLIILPTE